MTAWISIIIAAILSTIGSAAQGNELHRVDLMSNGRSDRVTFEFDHRTDYKFSSPEPNVIEVVFDDVDFAPDFTLPSLPSSLALIAGLRPQKNDKDKLVVTIHVQREASPSGLTLTVNPWTYAMDLTPKSGKNNEARPQYIPGDRPYPTKLSQTVPDLEESSGGVRLSSFALISFMILAYIIGVLSVFAAGYGMERIQRHFRSAPAHSPVSVPTVDTLNTEIQRDLARLKRIAEWEQGDASDAARRITEERERLILKLMKEGRSLDAIAEVLEMTPAQVRNFLDRQS